MMRQGDSLGTHASIDKKLLNRLFSEPVASEVRMVVSDIGEHTFPNIDAPRMQAKQ